MNKKRYSMILNNGTILNNLELNGNNYVSTIEVTSADFSGNISPIIISDGETEELLENMEFVRIANWENKWWILIQKKPPISETTKLRADIDYLSMMLDVEL